MAKGKYMAWMKDDKLEQVVNWAANGCTDRELASNMGISHTTFYDWMAKHPAIADAVKRGREMSVTAIENAFFKRALGGVVVTERVKEFRGEFKDGEPWNGHGMTRTVEKVVPGDVSAMIFFLKNRAGYRSEPAAEPDDAEALKRARELLAEVPSAIE